jgi:DNA-binding LytR/AlgR family response regulator
MEIKCITIDDEHLALKLLSDYISKIPNLKLSAQFKNAAEAVIYLQTNSVDLIFLDIQMPDLTGIDFLKVIENKPLVIFTTAFGEYALEGFDLGVIDYLVKPIPFERFLKAANKAAHLLNLENKTSRNINENENNKVEKNYLFIKSGYKSEKVDFDEILYIEGLKEYINIFTLQKRYVKFERMKNIEEFLPSNKFVRVHKSYIVAIEKVTSVYGNIIEIGKTEIPIGRSYKKLVEDIFS